MVEKLANPDWDNGRFYWEFSIPKAVEIWDCLTIETRVVAYLFAERIATPLVPMTRFSDDCCNLFSVIGNDVWQELVSGFFQNVHKIMVANDKRVLPLDWRAGPVKTLLNLNPKTLGEQIVDGFSRCVIQHW